MVSSRLPVIAVVGPTATGKSALAQGLAQVLGGEIVSADSMQVYEGMDIGTAKVPVAERSVAYHCLDLAPPGEPFDAYKYQQEARAALDDLEARGKQAVLCGGTGLYVRAALDDFVMGELDTSRNEDDRSRTQERSERRQRLHAQAEALGAASFHALLAERDPVSAARIHPNNVRRVVRAFEWLEEGSSYAKQAAGFNTYKEVYPAVFIGLDMPREELYVRINERVLRMVEEGLLEEVRSLLNKGYKEALTAQQAIGYKELVPVVEGKEDLASAIARIQQATRNYAKRQKSWFKRDARIRWLDARLPLNELLAETMRLMHE